MTQHFPRDESSQENIVKGDSLNSIPAKENEVSIPLEYTTKDKDVISEHSSELLPPCGGKVGKILVSSRNWISKRIFNEKGTKIFNFLMKCVLFSFIIVYIGYVVLLWSRSDCTELDWANGYGFAFILFGMIIKFIIFQKFVRPALMFIYMQFSSKGSDFILEKCLRIGYWILIAGIFIAFLLISLISKSGTERNFISLGGYATLLLFGLIFSKHPDYIKWRTVASGLALQMLIALMVIKFEMGRKVFLVIGQKAEQFLSFGYVGARFVYGDLLVDNFIFAFRTLPVLFFMVVIVNILFYYGILQKFCYNLGGLMQMFLGTTVFESINAVATVFLGMTESPLLFKPYLHQLTASEIHAVMAAGFSTVAGTVLAAYTSFGADPSNIITASAMAAPAALAFSKLFYPERRKSKTSADSLELIKSEDQNVLHAACNGAVSAIELVQGIIAVVVASVSMVAFFNSVVHWLGLLAGFKGLSFEVIVGKLFIPLAWLMGVQPSQCDDVARLIGIKTVINEFVAYKELGILKKMNRLSFRSEAIATIALCGFANPASVAIMVAVMSSLCPSQGPLMTKVALRSFIAGSCTSFLSACLAGVLIPENGFSDVASNVTSLYQNLSSCNLE